MAKVKTIGIIAIKGGVGKTTTVANLGSILAKDFGKKVLLVDANLSSPSLGTHLGIINPDFTLSDVLNDKTKIKTAIYKHELGFDVIPSNFTPHADAYSVFKLKEKLAKVSAKYDYVLIDSSPNLNNEMLLSMVAADQLLVVTTPDMPTLRCTLEAVEAAKRQKTPITGLILNKRRGKSFEIKKHEIEEQSQVPVLAILPDDVKVLEALAKSSPLSYYCPRRKTTKAYYRLAEHLVGEAKPRKSIGSRFKNFFSQYIELETQHEIETQQADVKDIDGGSDGNGGEDESPKKAKTSSQVKVI